MYVRAKKVQRFTCQDAIFNIFLYQGDSQAIQSPPSYRRFCVAVAGRAEVVPFVVN